MVNVDFRNMATASRPMPSAVDFLTSTTSGEISAKKGLPEISSPSKMTEIQ